MDCTIVCAAPCDIPRRELVEGFVIAADGGADKLEKLNIRPQLAVGDFDSLENLAALDLAGEVIRVPREKDDTDVYLAANEAIKRGFTRLRFLCALGGRLDHSLANIQMLYDLRKKGIYGELWGESERVRIILDESVVIPKFDGYLSLFAYENDVVISERGVKYPLDKKLVTNRFPLCISNEITEDLAHIDVKGAMILAEIFMEKDAV